MAEEHPQFTKRQLRRNAAIVVAVIVAFSCAFIAAVRYLDASARFAPHATVQTVEREVSYAVVESPGQESVPEEPFYVLLIGSDSRKGTALYTGKDRTASDDDSRADVITLMRVDPITYTITLVSVPRDTVLDGQTAKINDSLLGKHPERTVTEVEKLTGVDIDYYMMTSFISFEFLVDALGGVTVDVPATITVEDPLTAESVTVEAGKHKKLDGSQALVLARARKEYGAEGDVARQANVRALEVAMMQQVMENPEDSGAFVEALLKHTETDLDPAVVASTAAVFAEHADDVVFYSCTGPADGGTNNDGVWVVEEDAEAWVALMDVVDAGGNPAEAPDEVVN